MLVLLVVLLASAGLTAAAPPKVGDLALPFPPPAVGPVVSVGGRAGWVAIGATASQGQLVVRLTTPDTDLAIDPQDETSYTLAGNLAAPDAGRALVLWFRRCGIGCFVAPVTWGPGTSTVTLNAQSERFAGGKAALTISWPADSSPQLLRSVTGAMLAAPHVSGARAGHQRHQHRARQPGDVSHERTALPDHRPLRIRGGAHGRRPRSEAR